MPDDDFEYGLGWRGAHLPDGTFRVVHLAHFSYVPGGQLERCYEAATIFGAENSEVSPVEVFVAVTVMFRLRAMYLNVEKVKETWPEPSVVTVLEPRHLLPSFEPFTLEKNCTLKDSS
jgi:hypothetical protein